MALTVGESSAAFTITHWLTGTRGPSGVAPSADQVGDALVVLITSAGKRMQCGADHQAIRAAALRVDQLLRDAQQ